MTSLKINRFKNAEHARTIYYVSSEHGDTIDVLMRPEYWAHVAHALKSGDRIEVLAEDNTFYAEFHVFAAFPGGARVGLLRYEVFAANAKSVGMSDLGTPDYRVEWKYNRYKWCVIRTSDGVVISKEHADEEAARNWLTEYRKALAR